tara:strand:+ start:425 stop:1312 length:888 start_codon:yes stop_codon:yes gene_type:complete
MSFGSDDPQVTSFGGGVYGPAEPFVQDILQESARLYGSDVGREFFPGSTVVPFAPETQAAMDLQKGLGFAQTGQSPLLDIASGAMGGFASGVMPTAYSQLTPQADFLSGVRQSIGRDVMGDIATRFGSMGRTGTSPGATAAATRAFTDAYAPFALSQAEAERRAEQEAIENQIGRQLTAAQGLSGLQSDIDTRTESGIDRIFDVGARQEDLAARNLQDQIDRFQFSQTSPFERLALFQNPAFSAAGFAEPTQTFAAAPNPLTSAFGGAQSGYELGDIFNMGPAGAIVGGLLGGLI